MSRKDTHHHLVRQLLEAEGWIITADPLRIPWGDGNHHIEIDLAAERDLIEASRDSEKIAVEVKSFNQGSNAHELAQAAGQFVMYRVFIERMRPEYTLFLAITQQAFEELFVSSDIGTILSTELDLLLVVYDPFNLSEGLTWIPQP